MFLEGFCALLVPGQLHFTIAEPLIAFYIWLCIGGRLLIKKSQCCDFEKSTKYFKVFFA